jgi:hypothetical protein
MKHQGAKHPSFKIYLRNIYYSEKTSFQIWVVSNFRSARHFRTLGSRSTGSIAWNCGSKGSSTRRKKRLKKIILKKLQKCKWTSITHLSSHHQPPWARGCREQLAWGLRMNFCHPFCFSPANEIIKIDKMRRKVKMNYRRQEILAGGGAAKTFLDASLVALPVVVKSQLLARLHVHQREQADAPQAVHVPLRRLAVRFATVVYEPTQNKQIMQV